jgi:hypothetical protein
MNENKVFFSEVYTLVSMETSALSLHYIEGGLCTKKTIILREKKKGNFHGLKFSQIHPVPNYYYFIRITARVLSE